MANKIICDFCNKNVAKRQIKMNEKRRTLNGYWKWFGEYYDICESCYSRMLTFMKEELKDE